MEFGDFSVSHQTVYLGSLEWEENSELHSVCWNEMSFSVSDVHNSDSSSILSR